VKLKKRAVFLLKREAYITAAIYSARITVATKPLGDRAFPVAAPRAWNDLPPTIRASQSLLTFRQQLKTFLFNQLH